MSQEFQFKTTGKTFVPYVEMIQHKIYLDQLLNKPEDEHPEDIEDEMLMMSPSQNNFSMRNLKYSNHHDLQNKKIKLTSLKKLTAQNARKVSHTIFETQRIIKAKIKTFMIAIYLRTIAQLTREKFNHINDQASSYDNLHTQVSNSIDPEKRDDLWLTNNPNFKFFKATIICLKEIKTLLCNLYERIPTLQKDSKFLIFWTFFNALLKFCTFYWYTVSQFFDFNNTDCDQTNHHYLLHILLVQFLIFDILVSLNKSYISRGILIKSKLLIARNYFKKNFLYDFLSIIPVFIQIHENSSCKIEENKFKVDLIFYLKLLIFLLLRDFHNSIDEFQKQLKMQPKQKMFMDLGRLALLIIQLIHTFACMLKFTADLESNYLNYGITWLSEYNFQLQEWYVIYIYSFYWGTTIMITVGFGDITPKTPIETSLIICIMLIGCGFFGFSLNKIGAIIQELNKTRQDYQNDVEILGHFLSSKHVESDLMLRSLAYLEYIHSFQNTQEQEKQVLKKLPLVLQEEIIQTINQKIIGHFLILKNNFSKSSMEKIMGRVTEIVTAPGEVIMDSKSNSLNLYFLLEGQVEKIYQPNQIDNLIQSQNITNETNFGYQQSTQFRYTSEQISAGKIFGETEFFGGQSSSYLFRSKSFCKIYYIKRNEFLDVIKYNEDDVEKFQNIQNSINMNNDFSFFGLPCPACLSNQHTLKDCPSIHFKLNKINLALRQVQQNQQKVKYDRKGSKFPTLLKLGETKFFINAMINELRIASQPSYNDIPYEDDEESSYTEALSDENDGAKLDFSTENRNQMTKEYLKKNTTKHYDRATSQKFTQRTKSGDIKNNRSPNKKRSSSDLNVYQMKGNCLENLSHTLQISSQNFISFPINDQKQISLDIDRMKELKFYQTKWNFNNVLKLYNRKTKKVKPNKKSQKLKQLITNINPFFDSALAKKI